MKNLNQRWWIFSLLIALAALALAPAAIASQEDSVEKPSAAARAKSAAPAKAADDDDDEKSDDDKQAAVHPSFNTIEEIRALRGGVASLWSLNSESAPKVEWRETKPAKADEAEKSEIR